MLRRKRVSAKNHSVLCDSQRHNIATTTNEHPAQAKPKDYDDRKEETKSLSAMYAPTRGVLLVANDARERMPVRHKGAAIVSVSQTGQREESRDGKQRLSRIRFKNKASAVRVQ
jgi:hypothetical protein